MVEQVCNSGEPKAYLYVPEVLLCFHAEARCFHLTFVKEKCCFYQKVPHIAVHVPKENRTKWEPTAKKGIIVGYSESQIGLQNSTSRHQGNNHKKCNY